MDRRPPGQQWTRTLARDGRSSAARGFANLRKRNGRLKRIVAVSEQLDAIAAATDALDRQTLVA